MRVLGISGSLRAGSHNTRLLVAAASLLPAGAEFVRWDGLATLPAFNEDDEGSPAVTVVELRAAVAEADALLIATPEYNAGPPGALKNALDWLSRPDHDNVLRGRPAAVIGASTGLFGAVWAQDGVRKALSRSGAAVLEDELPIGTAHEALGNDGLPVDPDQRAALATIVATLADRARGSAA